MPDEIDNSATGATQDAGATEGGETAEELARVKREKDAAYASLRKRDAQVNQYGETIVQLTARLEAIEKKNGAQRQAPVGDDPEPDADTDPVGWMKWSKREDRRQAARDRERDQMDSLNSFGATSEQIARQQVPDYDQAMEFLRGDYRKELEESGELDETAQQAMRDPGQRQNILSHAAAKGCTEYEAALDLVANAAFEWRRQRIVLAQRRLGGNPALKAVDMAKRRGYGKPATQGKQGTTGVVDDALAELERKRNLRAAGNTTADVRDGGEVREKRAWTYDQLQELRRTNPREFNAVTKEIANDADSNPSILSDVIRH